MRDEICSQCDEPISFVGQGEDSLYCECGEGPFCSSCYNRHIEIEFDKPGED